MKSMWKRLRVPVALLASVAPAFAAAGGECTCGSPEFCDGMAHRIVKCVSITADRCELVTTNSVCNESDATRASDSATSGKKGSGHAEKTGKRKGAKRSSEPTGNAAPGSAGQTPQHGPAGG